MGCWEDICLKILFWLFLILSDYVENDLNLCPSSARRETVFGRLRAAAYDYLRLARNKLYRYHFDGNYSIFPYISLSSWIFFFAELNVCRNNTFIILRYVEGGIPLRHPHVFPPNLAKKISWQNFLHGHELVKINNEPIKERQALKTMQIPVRMAPTNGCRYKDTNISSGRSLKNNNCKFWANLRGKPNIL